MAGVRMKTEVRKKPNTTEKSGARSFTYFGRFVSSSQD